MEGDVPPVPKALLESTSGRHLQTAGLLHSHRDAASADLSM